LKKSVEKKTKQNIPPGCESPLGGDTDLDRKTSKAAIEIEVEIERERLEKSENQHENYKNIFTPSG